MQTQKMSLANIKGKLSRAEMKNIMAGSGSTSCTSDADCPNKMVICQYTTTDTSGHCYANSGTSGTTCHWAGCPS
ncbi:MAG: hypothetical protein M0Q26_14445 [Chitinophagaceae bacterium]|nr:hypothetical protein [Chitinophagaceae bacterium]